MSTRKPVSQFSPPPPYLHGIYKISVNGMHYTPARCHRDAATTAGDFVNLAIAVTPSKRGKLKVVLERV